MTRSDKDFELLTTSMTPTFIGDLSAKDAELLTTFSSTSESILEFGCGGSTQIFAQSSPGKILSIDTSPAWIESTREKLKLLGVENKVTFTSYEWRDIATTYDFIFDDGEDDGTGNMRLAFAIAAWPLLRVGGTFALHDTRHHHIARILGVLVDKHFMEIHGVAINIDGSNLSLIRKKWPEPYVNWNHAEGREPWMYGHGPVPSNWPSKP